MRPFSHLIKDKSEPKKKLTGCCLNPYNFGRLVKSMNFQPIFGQTSGEKIFEFFLLAQKNRRQISGGLLGVVLIFDVIFWSKSPKTPSCLLKDKKGRNS